MDLIVFASFLGPKNHDFIFFFPAFTRAPASPPPNSWVSDTAECASFPKTVSDLGFLAATPHESRFIHFRTSLLLCSHLSFLGGPKLECSAGGLWENLVFWGFWGGEGGRGVGSDDDPQLPLP